MAAAASGAPAAAVHVLPRVRAGWPDESPRVFRLACAALAFARPSHAAGLAAAALAQLARRLAVADPVAAARVRAPVSLPAPPRSRAPVLRAPAQASPWLALPAIPPAVR